MLTRENTLHNWLNKVVNGLAFKLSPLAGDASFRRYFRFHSDTSSYVVMDAPPEKEGLSAFIDIARMLRASGVHTPEIIAFDLDQGFALLEDFGDTLLLDDILPSRIEQHYYRALDTLHKIQACPIQPPQFSPFDSSMMGKELDLFRTWFLDRWLGLTLSSSEEKMLNQALTHMVTQILKQPTCLTHRDYHSRNLALIGPMDNPTIGVLDFQDAVLGPFTYDLVSLLKDAYIEWPEDTRLQWLNTFYNNLPHKQGWSRDAFEHGFHMTGLQRHLKILGIFCRLNIRDGKPRYLHDLPLTLNYVLASLKIDEPLRPLYDFMQNRVSPLFEEKKIA